jgi:hypothetical protein
MATTLAPSTAVPVRAKLSVPWYIRCAVLAVTSSTIGGHWDISWHSSIGRDTFWTPAHIAIYLCGLLASITFGYIILSTTFSSSAPLAEHSVHIWGFRAPLGAFIASWGGILMLVSAPFDNWWHDAYGLDVKIVSPPHIVLFLGVYGVLFGTLVLIAGHMNRETGAEQQMLRWLFLYVVGIILVTAMIILMEYTAHVLLHTSMPYLLVAAITPIPLAIAAIATRVKFAATFVAGFYMLFNITLILILPLFPAEPKLGPVYQNVTHFIPPQFPMLLIAPAFTMDLLWQRTRHWHPWRVAAISGILFVGVLLAVQWPFADFLLSPASRNRFFGTNYFWYGLRPMSYTARHEFFPWDGAAAFWKDIAIVVIACTITTRWGISRGAWFSKIKR